MQEAQTWRKLLGTIIGNAKEKQRIANELGVKAITLTRWVSEESAPRPQNLRLLLNVLPGQREQLLDLIRKEEGLEEFSDVIKDDTSKNIPSDFYTSVFMSRASTTENLRYWSTCQIILTQALKQLDPEHLGMAVWVVRCMPPSGFYHKVRSLREGVGIGTSPWGGNLYAGRIAGVFLVSSTQYNHFLSHSRGTLAQSYADLLALAFEPEDFYEPEDIALCVMPYHNEQKEYFAPFRYLVSKALKEAAQNNEPINNTEAEMRVWQQLEEQLIQVSASR